MFGILRSLQTKFNFREPNLANEISVSLNQHLTFVFLLLIPIFALFYKIFHKKDTYNFWHLLVAQTFLIAHILLFLNLYNLLLFSFPEIRNLVRDFVFAVVVIFQIFSSYQLYSYYYQNKKRLALRQMLIYGIIIGLTLIVFAIIVGVSSELYSIYFK